MEDVICPYCKQPCKLVDSQVIYGTSYGMMYLCELCDAYVGCHNNSKGHKPLGTPANSELREWRKKVHKHFDPLWKDGRMKRKDAYRDLAKFLNIKTKDCHIAMFGIETCKIALNFKGET